MAIDLLDFELAELDSIVSKKQAGTLKNDISSPKDYIRVPYGSSHDWFPRESVFMAQAKSTDFLRDETGLISVLGGPALRMMHDHHPPAALRRFQLAGLL